MCTKENPMWSEFGKAFPLVVSSHHFSSKGHHQFPHFRCQPLPAQIWAVTRWMYTGLTVVVLIGTDDATASTLHPKTTCSPHRLKWGRSDIVYKRTQYSQGVMVSAQRAAVWVSLLLSSHLTTCHWPLHAMPPQYLWLSSMHRLNPLTQELLLASRVLWENEKYSNHILYVQTTDSVPRNLQIWVLSGFLFFFYLGFFLGCFLIDPHAPHLLHFGVLVLFSFLLRRLLMKWWRTWEVLAPGDDNSQHS